MSDRAKNPHSFITIGQEMQCTRCRRRWDFDDPVPEDDECDAPPKNTKKSNDSVPRRRTTTRRRRY